MAKHKAIPSLRYVGAKKTPAYLVGIPAADLNPDQLEWLAGLPFTQRRLAGDVDALVERLLNTGLYELADSPASSEE